MDCVIQYIPREDTGVGTRVVAGSAGKLMSPRSSTGTGEDCPHSADSGMDLMVGSGLGTEEASRTNALAGSVGGGGSCTLSMAGRWLRL